ncbi:hypothetical protein PCE1_004963 [Barthelona sp. PCE]
MTNLEHETPLTIEDIVEREEIEKITYELYYFASRGVADAVRCLIADIGLKFTNEIIDTVEELEELHFPPMLLDCETNTRIYGHRAVLRYIARRHGYYGLNIGEAAFIDSLTEYALDLQSNYWLLDECVEIQDTEKSSDHRIEILKTEVEHALTYFDSYIENIINTPETCVIKPRPLVNDRRSYLDVCLYSVLSNIHRTNKSLLPQFEYLWSYIHEWDAKKSIQNLITSGERF